jgi:hypothetical protein
MGDALGRRTLTEHTAAPTEHRRLSQYPTAERPYSGGSGGARDTLRACAHAPPPPCMPEMLPGKRLFQAPSSRCHADTFPVLSQGYIHTNVCSIAGHW